MEKNKFKLKPLRTNSALENIQGIRFSLLPMSDDYIDIILGAIKKVNTDNIYSQTDHTSTVYRGIDIHVIDALKAAFIHSYREKTHLVMQATFSKGCPGDKEVDFKLCDQRDKANEALISDSHFNVLVKFSLYPLGKADYMKDIYEIVEHSKEMNVYDGSGHYVTFLRGDVQDIFHYFEDTILYCSNKMKHYVIEASFIVNLPEEEM